MNAPDVDAWSRGFAEETATAPELDALKHECAALAEECVSRDDGAAGGVPLLQELR